jgi:hypothetical protein
MYFVAIARLSDHFETPQLLALANDLGTTAYELRLLLNAGFPAVVLTTADEAKAKAVTEVITRHKHVALYREQSQILSPNQMTTLRSFTFTPTALLINDTTELSCPYEDISILLRANHRDSQTDVELVKERSFRPLTALATGGLVMTKTSTREVTTTTAKREQVLYIFRRGAAHPWLLRERVANYATLGAEMAPSSLENFAKTLTRLRTLSAHAIYDERLLGFRKVPGLGDGSAATALLAYLLSDFFSELAPRPNT